MKGAVAVTLLAALPATLAALSASSLKVSSDTLTLPASFDPIEGMNNCTQFIHLD